MLRYGFVLFLVRTEMAHQTACDAVGRSCSGFRFLMKFSPYPQKFLFYINFYNDG
jgi:hypothetical protein